MKEMKCAICGETHEYPDPVDFSILAEADLAGLPKFLGTDSYETMVQRCPHCGYCSFDVSKKVIFSDDILKSEGYRYILETKDFKKSVANMVAVAYIYECQENNYSSARAYSYASKMLEMQGEEERSFVLKEQEVRLLLLHITTQNFKKEFDIKVYQYLIDALRRLKKFDKAIKFCDVALSKTYSSTQKNVFYLEKSLCMNFIADSHEFSYSNGEYTNFYQILVGGFGTAPTEITFKHMYHKIRSYLEGSVYFPIAEGADFIVKVEETKLVDMDKLIEELRKTYISVSGEVSKDIVAESEKIEKAEERPQQIKIDQKQEQQPVKILTLNALSKEKQMQKDFAQAKSEISRLQAENQEREEEIFKQKDQIKSLSSQLEISNQEISTAKSELQKAKENTASANSQREEIIKEIENLACERRKIINEFDTQIYNLTKENLALKEELERAKFDLKNINWQVPTILSQDELLQREEDPEQVDIEDQKIEDWMQEVENSIIQSSEINQENKEIAYCEDINQSEYAEKIEKEEDMAEFILDDFMEEMILNIAKVSGKAEVSDVQNMLSIGYKNAKFAMDKLSNDGKLEEIEEDIYAYIEE